LKLSRFLIITVILFEVFVLTRKEAPSQIPVHLIYVNSAPSGACSNVAALQRVISSGDIWGCNAGTWVKITAGNGGSSALIQISQVTTSGSQTSVVFSSIPGTYTSLRLISVTRSLTSATSDQILIKFNADSTAADYGYQVMYGSGTGSATAGSASGSQVYADIPAASSTANDPVEIETLIPSYAGTTFNKQYYTNESTFSYSSGSYVFSLGGIWVSTAAINAITLTLSSGAGFVNGSVFTLYGVQ
jgi:hypothetical protein